MAANEKKCIYYQREKRIKTEESNEPMSNIVSAG